MVFTPTQQLLVFHTCLFSAPTTTHCHSSLVEAAGEAGDVTYRQLAAQGASLPPYPQFQGGGRASSCCWESGRAGCGWRLLEDAVGLPTSQAAACPHVATCSCLASLAPWPALCTAGLHLCLPTDTFTQRFVAGFTRGVLDAAFGASAPAGAWHGGRRLLGAPRSGGGPAGLAAWLRRALLQQPAFAGQVQGCTGGGDCRGNGIAGSAVPASEAAALSPSAEDAARCGGVCPQQRPRLLLTSYKLRACLPARALARQPPQPLAHARPCSGGLGSLVAGSPETLVGGTALEAGLLAGSGALQAAGAALDSASAQLAASSAGQTAAVAPGGRRLLQAAADEATAPQTEPAVAGPAVEPAAPGSTAAQGAVQGAIAQGTQVRGCGVPGCPILPGM